MASWNVMVGSMLLLGFGINVGGIGFGARNIWAKQD
jgi:hypothetical protein